MNIQKIDIKNFKKIDRVTLDLNGKNIYLIGPNASGKTSFIDACFLNLPTEALKKETRAGFITVTLNDYVIEYAFTNKSAPKLTITNSEGEIMKAPATLLKELFGVKDFNIDVFLSQSSTKKIEVIKNIIGLDWADVDAEYKKLYAERTFINRKIKELEAKNEGETYDLSIKDLSPIDISLLQKDLDQAHAFNNELFRIRDGVKARKNEIEVIANEIKSLQNKSDFIASEVTKGEAYLEGKEIKDVTLKSKEITDAILLNTRISSNINIGKLREEEGVLVKEEIAIEEKLNEIKDLKKRQLEAVKMPVDGLTFNEDDLFLDGLPFDSAQINTARRIIAGLEIQSALIGEVKIARLDGSLLDNNSIKHVESWAKSKDIQLFIELVDRNAEEIRYEITENN